MNWSSGRNKRDTEPTGKHRDMFAPAHPAAGPGCQSREQQLCSPVGLLASLPTFLSLPSCCDNADGVISGGPALQIWPEVSFAIEWPETCKTAFAGNNDFVADFKFQLNINAEC